MPQGPAAGRASASPRSSVCSSACAAPRPPRRRRPPPDRLPRVVVDAATGAPIERARVSLDGHRKARTLSNAQGRVVLADLPAGRGVLEVSLIGYAPGPARRRHPRRRHPRADAPARRRHRHLHRGRRGHGGDGAARDRRRQPDHDRQRRHRGAAQHAHRGPDARRADAGRRRRQRRLPQRLLDPRRAVRSPQRDARRHPQLAARAHRPPGARHRIAGDAQQRHPRGRVGAVRQLPAALRQPDRIAGRLPHARGIAGAAASTGSRSARSRRRPWPRARSGAPAAARGW